MGRTAKTCKSNPSKTRARRFRLTRADRIRALVKALTRARGHLVLERLLFARLRRELKNARIR